MAKDVITVESMGDNALLVRLGILPDRECFERIRSFDLALSAPDQRLAGFVESVPAYTTLAVFFDPVSISTDTFRASLLKIADNVQRESRRKSTFATNEAHASRLVEVPVCYGDEFGPDLAFVASSNHLRLDEVIELHLSTTYFVHMVGFLPGFPYLGGLSTRIATPRKLTPRTHVAAGSVGIAGSQTGIYPISSPGGWQIIGRSPLRLFDTEKKHPSLIQAGDTVRFVRIYQDEFLSLLAKESNSL